MEPLLTMLNFQNFSEIEIGSFNLSIIMYHGAHCQLVYKWVCPCSFIIKNESSWISILKNEQYRIPDYWNTLFIKFYTTKTKKYLRNLFLTLVATVRCFSHFGDLFLRTSLWTLLITNLYLNIGFILILIMVRRGGGSYADTGLASEACIGVP